MFKKCLICGYRLQTEETQKRGISHGCMKKLQAHNNLFLNPDGTVDVNKVIDSNKCFNCVYFKQVFDKKLKKQLYKKFKTSNVLLGYCTLKNKQPTVKASAKYISKDAIFDGLSQDGCEHFFNKHINAEVNKQLQRISNRSQNTIFNIEDFEILD